MTGMRAATMSAAKPMPTHFRTRSIGSVLTQHETREHGDAAEDEMRRTRQELEAQRPVEDAGAEGDAHGAVEEIERAEDLEEGDGRALRHQPCDQRPQRGGGVQDIVE